MYYTLDLEQLKKASVAVEKWIENKTILPFYYAVVQQNGKLYNVKVDGDTTLFSSITAATGNAMFVRDSAMWQSDLGGLVSKEEAEKLNKEFIETAIQNGGVK